MDMLPIAGISRAAWDTEEDRTLIEIFSSMNICWIAKMFLSVSVQ